MTHPFTSFHRKWCMDKTQYFIQLEYSQWFRDPPERSVSNYPEYVSIVKNPICLTEISDRIKQQAYRYVHEWDNDMMRVFENAMTYNGEDTQPYLIASYLLSLYKEICHPIPLSQEELDIQIALKEVQKLADILSSPPATIKQLTWHVGDFHDLVSAENEQKWNTLDIKEKPINDSLAHSLSLLLEQIKQYQNPHKIENAPLVESQ